MNRKLVEMCFEITAVCPMACLHCSSFEMGQNRFDMRAMIPLERIKEVVRDFRALGGEVLQVSGGEPLLHPHLFEALRFSKDLGLHLRLYTSGLIGLGRKDIRPIDMDFAARLKETGLDRLIFNLQGATPETHEAVTKTPGSFEVCRSSIVASKSVGLWVGIHFVPMKLNYTELEDTAALAEQLSADELAVLRFVPQGRGEFYRERLELPPEEVRSLGERLLAIKARYKNLRIRTGSPMNFLQTLDPNYQPVQCAAGRSTCNITADGSIVPCPAFKKVSGFTGGNVLRQNLAEAWNTSPVFQIIRATPESELYGECLAQKVIAGRSAHPAELHRLPVKTKDHLEIERLRSDLSIPRRQEGSTDYPLKMRIAI